MLAYFDNIIFSLQRAGGISSVWQNLLRSVTEESGIDPYFLEYREAGKNLFRQELELAGGRIIPNNGSVQIERYENPGLRGVDGPFVFHSSYYRYCKNSGAINFTTVHDFTYEYFVRGMKKRIHQWQKYGAIRNSRAIVCISENTRRDLFRFVPEARDKDVHVIYNGVSEEYHVIEGKERERPDSVLFVGARSGYKNFRFLVDGISDTKYNLVICGSPIDEDERLYCDSKLGPDRYVVYSGISNGMLNELYNSVHCLVYPSSYEGFGIPVVEAQKSGCPVIALRASSIPEVIGRTPLMMNELNARELKGKLDLLKAESIRQEVVEEGLMNASRFSWNKMCRQYLELYNEYVSPA